MSYVEQHLVADESVTYSTGLHPAKAYAVATTIGALTVLISVVAVAAAGGVVAFWVFLFGAALTGLATLDGWLQITHTEFAVTDRRVIAKAGWISSNSVEVNLAQVEGIQVKQDVLGKICGFGTVVVTGTGGTHDPFQGIRAPQELRREVQQQLEAAR